MKIKKNTFSTLALELFFPSIANCRKLKIQKIQKSTSPSAYKYLKIELKSNIFSVLVLILWIRPNFIYTFFKAKRIVYFMRNKSFHLNVNSVRNSFASYVKLFCIPIMNCSSKAPGLNNSFFHLLVKICFIGIELG
jgi:hypothetical protein